MQDERIRIVVDRFLSESGAHAAQLRSEYLPAPHERRALPTGYQGVYLFMFGGQCLKAGQAGPKSGPRWVSHHYKAGRANSTLAWSLIRYAHFGEAEDPILPRELKSMLQGIRPDDIGLWMQRHLDRCNLLLDAALGKKGLNHLEAVAHEIVGPVFEGTWKYGGPAV